MYALRVLEGIFFDRKFGQLNGYIAIIDVLKHPLLKRQYTNLS
jgi:hypothetical protein